MRNYGNSPVQEVLSFYRRHYGILWDYVPELIAMRAGLREATQLSLDSTRYNRVRPQLEVFCRKADLKLRTYERRGKVKVLLSTASTAEMDPTDEARLGDMFGYPRCCVEHFMAHKETLVEPFVNQMAELLGNRDSVDFRMNLFLRPSPLHLVRHFPCAIDCAETLDRAEQLLRAMGRLNQRLYDEVVRFNRSSVLYLDVCGAGLVFEGERDHNRLRYSGTYCAVNVPTLLPLSGHNTMSDCDLLDELASMLELGDELLIRSDELEIRQKGQWLATFPRPDHLVWRLLSFE